MYFSVLERGKDAADVLLFKITSRPIRARGKALERFIIIIINALSQVVSMMSRRLERKENKK